MFTGEPNGGGQVSCSEKHNWRQSLAFWIQEGVGGTHDKAEFLFWSHANGTNVVVILE